LSEHTRRDGTRTFPRPALTTARLPRSTTDRLLDGGVGPEPLRQLLAAAAAPAQADELGGEQEAHRAFITAARFPPLIGAAPHNPRRRTRALSWIVAAKAIAAVALTAGAGGVAVATTSGSFPGGLPAVSTQQKSDPDPDSGRPTVVVDRARGTAQRPDTQPAPASSAGSPDSPRDSTDPGKTSTGTVPPARSDQPGRSETESAPDDGTPAAPPSVVPGNPQHATGSANSTKKSTAKTPPGQQKAKENHGDGTAATKKDDPGNSENVGDPRSDTAKQRQKAQE
jgi:hypothetical protein